MPKREADNFITINNEKIIKFFHEHQNLDIEQTFLTFIDIMEKLSDTLNNSINSTTINSLFDNIKSMQDNLTNINLNMNKFQNDILANFTVKLNEIKREYVEDLKLILSQNVSDKISPLIKEHTQILNEKTTALINTVVPSSNKDLQKSLNKSVESINEAINRDTQRLLDNNISTESLKEFINSVEGKFGNIISQNQTLFNNTISASEKRIDSRIREVNETTTRELSTIRELSNTSNTTSKDLSTSLTDLLKKMENSSTKGKISENLLLDILHNLYPSAQIDSVGQQKETGDIMLIRNNRPKILVENKIWNKNVVQEEIKKFIHDIETQNCCGVFLSQNYGIAGKENFEINIHDGNVLVYVHEVNNDPDKIKIAIDIIDHFYDKLEDCIDQTTEIDSISKDKLTAINTEFQTFIHSKLTLVKMAKEFNQKFLKQIDDLKIPTLEEYLSSKYSSSSSKITCEYCGFVAKNHQAKSAHMRGCQVKKTLTANKGDSNIINVE